MVQKHILIVDDEILIADQIASFLEKNGFRTTCVGSGEKAIAAMQDASPPDLILMDIDLGQGRMDGTETARRINLVHDIPWFSIHAITMRRRSIKPGRYPNSASSTKCPEMKFSSWPRWKWPLPFMKQTVN